MVEEPDQKNNAANNIDLFEATEEGVVQNTQNGVEERWIQDAMMEINNEQCSSPAVGEETPSPATLQVTTVDSEITEPDDSTGIPVDTPVKSNVSNTARQSDEADEASGLEEGTHSSSMLTDDDTCDSSFVRRAVSFQLQEPESNMVDPLLLLVGSSHRHRGESGQDSITSLASMESNLSEVSSVFLAPLRSDNRSPFMENNSRMSLVHDLETGKEGVRGHRAKIRPHSLYTAGSATARRRRGVKKLGKRLVNPFWRVSNEENNNSSDEESPKTQTVSLHGRHMVKSTRVWVHDEESDDNDEDHPFDHWATQYRLQTISTSDIKSRFEKGFEKTASAIGFSSNLTIYEDTVAAKNTCKCFGIHPNELVISYLNWTFRSSFFSVILSACAAFFGATFFFALIIYAIGMRKPHCVHVNGVDFGTHDAAFLDAYSLSWTTFSTVGYGLIFPATSSTAANIKDCTGITVLATLESFCGILFGSLWGAIFFAKVTRVASVAQVTFSDAVVLRYGAGLIDVSEEDDDDDDEEASNASNDDKEKRKATLSFAPSKLPCPMLEFRVLNNLHNQPGGEIIDASMNMVASIDESQASTSLRNSVRGVRRGGKKKVKRRSRRVGGRSRQNVESFIVPNRENLEKAKETLKTLISASRNQRIVEDPSGKFIPKRIFAKLDFESHEHPFFKRIWLARHVLDHHSPLLKQAAKELIRLNGGHWPEELNNPEAVRASVLFDQIVVSLSGTSNVDANSVYAQKVYDYVDICVGYRFCNTLFRASDGSISVDNNLLNDVVEQSGGGGEDLQTRAEEGGFGEIFIL